MKNKTLVVSLASLFLFPALAYGDPPWGTPPGHNKHWKKNKGEPETVYVYKEQPPAVVYVPAPPQNQVIYVPTEAPPQNQVVYVPTEAPPQAPVAAVSADVGISRGTCNRDAVGTAVGGIVGGVIGSQVGRHNGNQGVGMVVGAIAGALLGNQIGKNMDESDQRCTLQTLEQAKDGQTITWRNPENGMDYKMTPVETYQKNGQECRRYVAVVASDAKREEVNREACKQPDGNWEIHDLKVRS